LKGDGINAKRRQQRGRYCAVRPRTVDPKGAAIDELDFPIKVELVSFGVAAEIIMIVEDQDTDIGTHRCTIEIGCCEPADATPHHD